MQTPRLLHGSLPQHVPSHRSLLVPSVFTMPPGSDGGAAALLGVLALLAVWVARRRRDPPSSLRQTSLFLEQSQLVTWDMSVTFAGTGEQATSPCPTPGPQQA